MAENETNHTSSQRKTTGKSNKKRILVICLACLLAVAAAAAGVLLVNEFTVTVTLREDAEITVEWGSNFADPGAEAEFFGSLIKTAPEKVSVTVHGQVDTARLGVYELIYTAQKQLGWFFGNRLLRAEEKRVVHVVDTVQPEITLLTNPDYFTLPGHDYVEEGFTATDNHDGDLTDSVQLQIENDRIYYRVTDASGNTAEVVRQIIYSDPIAPTVLLEGKQEMVVLVGSSYEEPGYSALDNLDGDISDRVSVQGSVDPQTMGTYQLQYTVTDSYGNVGTAVRTVIVRDFPELPDNMFPGQAEEIVVPEGKVIYLTFDDGPCAYTNELLDTLEKYQVKATFFVIKPTSSKNIAILKRIAEEGHTIGMHCSEHTYKKIYASEEAYFADLKEVQDVIYEHTGVISTIVRFPGGSSNTVSKFNPGIMTRLTKMLDAMGYRYFDWNVGSSDAGGVFTREAVFQNVTSRVQGQDISVVLQHDIKHFSVQAVEDIIKWGKKHGYTFLPLTNNSPEIEFRVKN